VHTEEHRLDDQDFEGVIAGAAVLVWDAGIGSHRSYHGEVAAEISDRASK
jgi:hypothetical protein